MWQKTVFDRISHRNIAALKTYNYLTHKKQKYS